MNDVKMVFQEDVSIRKIKEEEWLNNLTEPPKILDVDPLDEEVWLQKRREGIGASDIPKLFLVDNFGSPRQVYLSKVREPKTFEVKKWKDSELSAPLSRAPSEAADTGSVKEAFIAWQFERRTGFKTTSPANMFQGQFPLQVSIDRLIEGQKAILEIKNVSEWYREEWADGKLPLKVYLQVQAQLSIFSPKDKVKAYVIGEIGGSSYYIREVEADWDLINEILVSTKAFWEEFVEKRVCPPAIIERDVQTVSPSEMDHKNIHQLSLHEVELLDRLLYLKEDISEKTKERTKIESYFRDILKDKTKAQGANRYINYSAKEKKVVDVERLKHDAPKLYQSFVTKKEVFDEKGFLKNYSDKTEFINTVLTRRLTTGIKK